MSAQQLADACATLGFPLQRSVLANLENGRRPTLNLSELLVLARALKAPPILLVFPLGEADRVEVVPGHELDTWEAVKWFAGEMPFPGGDQDEVNAWIEASKPIALYREHDRLVEGVQLAIRESAPGSGRVLRESLRKYRERFRQRGLTPPDLPPELQHVDAATGPADPER
ncbi:hypothetical protein GCM10023196_053790 [Actinoallomurus vinaceus]|uniref:HTH cro/C1-type domain-containing protein n=2 Tax=Actinoallomurus vinaceus TaxID=1080074 RepID=A0ABP8UFE9_9ACTN